MSQAIYDRATEFLGIKEVPGSNHNPEIVAMAAAVGHGWVKDDETPWCASFVGMCLSSLGIPSTGKLNARSYQNWGVEVPLEEAQKGDVVVFSRGDPAGWQGHVGFYAGQTKTAIKVLGGNQGNEVSIANYSKSRLLSIRRYMNGGEKAVVPAPETSGVKTIREGASGILVGKLQDRLRELGYFHGARDQIFGPATDAAVIRFQRATGLSPDGIVGPQTWTMLMEADVENEVGEGREDATVADLRDKGSRTIKLGDMLQGILGVGGIAGVAEGVQEVSTQLGKAQEAAGEATTILGMLGDNWQWILVIIGAGFAFKYVQDIKEARAEDHRTGAHMGR